MHQFYKSVQGKLEERDDFVVGCWLSVVNSGEEEISNLNQKYDIPLEFLTYPLDIDETARIEKENDFTLLLLKIPYHRGDAADIPLITVPLGIIFTPQMIVTVCLYENEVLERILAGKIKYVSTGKKMRFLLHILIQSASVYLNYLRQIYRKAELIEDESLVSSDNQKFVELSNLEKSLVYFVTAIRTNEFVMEKVKKGGVLEMFVEDDELLEDVIIENSQALEMANIYSNILSSMSVSMASIISNELNAVMKFLTSITIILTIPTVITSIYGMNVFLPLASSPGTFYCILLLSGLISLVAVVFFIRKKWF